MKTLLFAAVLSLSSISHADIIKCSFTEPFVDTTYSMSQSTLTYSHAMENHPTVIRHVSFQIKSANVFELVGRNGQVLQTLTLSNRGSDGMGETVYPYEVRDASMLRNANNGEGGCTSNFLHSTQPTDPQQ